MESARSDERTLPRWRSLRWRLPLLASGLIAAIVASSLWLTERELEKALLRTGGERATAAADQVSVMMAQAAARGTNEVRRVASDPALRAVVTEPTSGSDAARRLLVPLAAAGQPPVEVRGRDGALLLRVGPERGAALTLDADVPLKEGLTPFFDARGTVFYGVVAAIAGSAPDSEPGPLGYLVVRRVLTTAQNTETLKRLVGGGAVVAIGNQSEGVWTNFSTVLAAPPVDRTRKGVSSYRTGSGELRVGAMSMVAGTAWATWIEFPEQRLLEPLYAVRRRMAILGVAFIVAAAAVVSLVSARITRPLQQMAAASMAIADGSYAGRIDTDRRDEIGRLGAAFNLMAARVDAARRDLEARVSERTATLTEARSALERHVGDLSLARAELDRFFSLSIDLLCIADCDGRFLRVNPAWQQTLGWTPEELTTRPYLEFVHPDDRGSTASEAASLAGGDATFHFENRYRARDGSYRWLSWTSAPAVDVGRIYATARDITREKEIAATLERHVAELKATNDELESFTYSVSHDLRAPLRHVTGFASLLEQSAADRLTDTEVRYLRTVVDAARRMGRLIDDLLAFSRMGRTPLATRHVQLDRLVAEAVEEVSGDGAAARVEWQIHPLPEADGDPAMLRLALINLVGNAVKYSAGRPQPVVEIGEDGSTARDVVLYVRDNGVGFDMQYAHKLFGVFQRLHSGDDFEGTGIGLASVRRIVNRHGGRVWAEAAVDGGATFYVALPRAVDVPA